jgi:hypothetical protein
VALGVAWVGVAGWCFAHHHVWLPVILPGVLALHHHRLRPVQPWSRRPAART